MIHAHCTFHTLSTLLGLQSLIPSILSFYHSPYFLVHYITLTLTLSALHSFPICSPFSEGFGHFCAQPSDGELLGAGVCGPLPGHLLPGPHHMGGLALWAAGGVSRLPDAFQCRCNPAQLREVLGVMGDEESGKGNSSRLLSFLSIIIFNLFQNNTLNSKPTPNIFVI